MENLPLGYRFVPTDEELITYYLRRKIMNLPLLSNTVKELDLYHHTPDQLQGKYGAHRENEMYFFTKRTLNTPTATRPSRTITNVDPNGTIINVGFWKCSTKKKAIQNADKEVIGYKMLFNHFVAKGNMTTWLMYEYTTLSGSRMMDEFVLCKIYNKNNEQKHKLNAQREKPQRSMEPQAHQVAEHVEIARINYTEEPNVCDYRPPEEQAPTYQYCNSDIADAPMNAADPCNQQYLTPFDDNFDLFIQSLEAEIPTHDDLQFDADLHRHKIRRLSSC
ncbi:NAC transcription factor 29 [Morus notabilis]|uniref:NAC transcription factor 29 n=1 Tax=Morus notabilis TaxID=981085 RepID=UPI000CED4179|nr:NAC transcription factor 29 [Morus notabilis]